MKRLSSVLFAGATLVLLSASTAVAQNIPDPAVEPEKMEAPWIWVLMWGVLIITGLVCVWLLFRYMLWNARSSAIMEGEDAVLRPVVAPKVQLGAVAPRPPAPAPVASGSFAAVAAAPAMAAAPAAVAAPAAPAAAEVAAAPAADAAPAPAAPAAAEAAPTAAPVEEKKVEVEPDQETYDRVLAEQVAKGVDGRVAEGRAKAAAMKAARAKAGG